MKVKRKIIQIDEGKCTGCGQCVPSCAEGAIQVVDGKARLVSEVYCDGLGACLGECPEGALCVTEQASEEFDPEAVEHHLREQSSKPAPEPAMACGCPSQNIQMFASPCEQANRPKSTAHAGGTVSALSHWPVQIKLVPAEAPFLKGADLLVAADCTSFAYPDFHRDLLPGKVVLIGCPKFDDTDAYLKKFADIFRRANVRSVTVVDMEVPCCSKLPMIVRHAMAMAGKEIPLDEVIISVRGEILQKERQIA